MATHIITALHCREHRIECDTDGVLYVFETWLRKMGHVPLRNGKPVLRVKARGLPSR
jgi:hypothetical protein